MNGELGSRRGWVLLGAILISGAAVFFAKETFFWVLGPIVVDYWAFAAGIFLMGEGLWRIMRSNGDRLHVHFFRLLRISIGVCVFTIHFLQFVRDGKLGG